MTPPSQISRWLNFQTQARHTRTDKTDKTNSVSYVSGSPPRESLEIGVGSPGQGKAERATVNFPYGPGRPSPENARRPIADRLTDARRLVGEMESLYLQRLPVEGDEEAMATLRQSVIYLQWRALG